MRICFEFFIICLVLIFIVGTDTIFRNMATPCPLVIPVARLPAFENLKRFQVFTLLNAAPLGRMVKEWDDYEVVHFKAIVGIVNLNICCIATCCFHDCQIQKLMKSCHPSAQTSVPNV